MVTRLIRTRRVTVGNDTSTTDEISSLISKPMLRTRTRKQRMRTMNYLEKASLQTHIPMTKACLLEMKETIVDTGSLTEDGSNRRIWMLKKRLQS